MLLAMFIGCFSNNNTYKLSIPQEADLVQIISGLKKREFVGSIIIDSKEIRNSSAEIVNSPLSDSIYKIASRYSFTRIVMEPEFTYFVINGFKGSNYGLLFTNVKEEDIKGFYDVKFIRPSRKEAIGKWYFVSSKLY